MVSKRSQGGKKASGIRCIRKEKDCTLEEARLIWEAREKKRLEQKAEIRKNAGTQYDLRNSPMIFGAWSEAVEANEGEDWGYADWLAWLTGDGEFQLADRTARNLIRQMRALGDLYEEEDLLIYREGLLEEIQDERIRAYMRQRDEARDNGN